MRPEQDKLDIIRANVDFTIGLAMADYDRKGMNVLEIGLLEGGAKDLFQRATVTTLDMVEGADIKADLTEKEDIEKYYANFDCILCTEVLEHTSDPFFASLHLMWMLKPNGRAYITTPFNFRIHNPLPDNWRFTEHGLRQLFRNFTILELEGIGDKELNPICYRTIVEK